MPRKNPFPASEAAICKRVRDARLDTELSQVAFARRIGMDSTQLAALEHCRAPLKYGIADRLCDEFDICQRWLATGKLPKQYYVPLAPRLAATTSDNDLFSSVYSAELSPFIDAHLAAIAEASDCSEDKITGEMASLLSADPAGSEPWELFRNLFFHLGRLQRKRERKQSDAFFEEFNELFDKVFPPVRPSADRSTATEFSASVGEVAYELATICAELPKSKAQNFLRQIAHYMQTLSTSYARPGDVLALANSRDSFPPALSGMPARKPKSKTSAAAGRSKTSKAKG
jgi:transcriptional regulator with XRE-family HTH domain